MAIPSIFSAYHDPRDCHVASLLAMTEVDGGWSCCFSAVEIGGFARPVGGVGRRGRRPLRQSRTHDVGDGALDVPAARSCAILIFSANSQHFPTGRPGGRPLQAFFDKLERGSESFLFFLYPAHFYSFCPALSLQIIWVMVPMGQKLHQVRGLYRVFTTRPMMVEVSMML